ncbi:uncharacterized protein LOC128762527 isoform X1 [Synchiropus splendidus]|uniref:uncharacterized protein LOC128762527 isoform X1 n=1 Tax=Synchiropus splendidus TaxID=270530 RepID=UPI00237E1D2B|nr:uncharacterized protein LOC128762527 isoform X1 [Synchiropus splendidus]
MCSTALQQVCAFFAVFMTLIWSLTATRLLFDVSTCDPAALSQIVKLELNDSLQSFDKANGNNLGTWNTGFPELKSECSSPSDPEKVVCGLHFIHLGLKKILKDQETRQSPTDVTLHKQLNDTLLRVDHLAQCVKYRFNCGKCGQPAHALEMPVNTFERKQWSHTFLKEARHYVGCIRFNQKFYKAGKQRWPTKARHQSNKNLWLTVLS